jgi:hypothetical protein
MENGKVTGNMVSAYDSWLSTWLDWEAPRRLLKHTSRCGVEGVSREDYLKWEGPLCTWMAPSHRLRAQKLAQTFSFLFFLTAILWTALLCRASLPRWTEISETMSQKNPLLLKYFLTEMKNLINTMPYIYSISYLNPPGPHSNPVRWEESGLISVLWMRILEIGIICLRSHRVGAEQPSTCFPSRVQVLSCANLSLLTREQVRAMLLLIPKLGCLGAVLALLFS